MQKDFFVSLSFLYILARVDTMMQLKVSKPPSDRVLGCHGKNDLHSYD